MNDHETHDEGRLDEWRELFPVTERWVYLDHAAVAPISVPVHDAMVELLDDVVMNGVYHARRWSATYDSARVALAKLLAVEPRSVAFAKNTSEGLSFVATGFPWREGDAVVTAESEFPSNRFPWLNLASLGVETILVAERGGTVLVEEIVAAMSDRTRVLAISAVEYATGWRMDLAALGEECRKRDILFVVDAIQALGALDIRPERYGIDVLAADGHKWMLGPEGAAIVYFSDRALERLRVAEVGWSSVANPGNYEEQRLVLHKHARRFECGTPTTVGLYGLGAAAKLIGDIGIETIERRVLALGDLARERCRERGWSVVGAQEGPRRSAIVSFTHPKEAKTVVKALHEESVQVAARAGRIRLSPHFYNAEWEIDRAFEALDAAAHPSLPIIS